MSLSSNASPYGSYGSSLSAELSAGYSTAPTSAVTTPGMPFPPFDDKPRIRHVGLDGRGLIAVPQELRSATRLGATPGIVEEGDYFSIPVRKPLRQKRQNFNFWHDLPSELRLHVLSYLEARQVIRCSAVSKLWHAMCFDGQLWSDLDTSEFYQDIPADTLVKIITAAGPFVRHLNLRGCAQLREKWSSEGLLDACSNLENFTLEGCRIDRSSIHCLLLQNTRLISLNLSGLANATNSTMKMVSQACPMVESLNVSWCNNIDTRGLRKVVEACPNLKDIRAGEVRGWDDVDFMQLLFEKNTLERLILMNCDSLNDESFTVLIEGTDSEVDYLTGRRIVPPRAFKHLDLTRCRGIGDSSVATLINNIPYMEGLQLSKLSDISDQTLTALIPTMPKLTHLDLEELDTLSNSVLQTLAAAPCAKVLHHLGISYCENLGDVGMLNVLKKCINLRSLDMDNTRISDLTLAEAATLVRSRTPRSSCNLDKPNVGLRLVAYDCQNVSWTGIREVLSRNAEVITSRSTAAASSSFDNIGENAVTSSHPSATRTYPAEIIQLKCFYNWQPTVEEHTKRVLKANFAAANRLEKKWAEFMVAQEEAGAGGAGARRRRRRAREAQMMHADEEGEGGNGTGGAVGGGRRRRARSGGCLVM